MPGKRRKVKWKVIGSPLRIAGLEFRLVATHVDKSFAIFLFFVANLASKFAPSALHNGKVYKQKPELVTPKFHRPSFFNQTPSRLQLARSSWISSTVAPEPYPYDTTAMLGTGLVLCHVATMN